MHVKNRYLIIFLALSCLSIMCQAEEALSQSQKVDIIVACERTEHDYALYRGNNDAEAFANIFTEGGVWHRASGARVGRQAIADYIRARTPEDDEPQYHLQFNTTIQIKPTSATTAEGVSYALVNGAPVPEDGGAAIVDVGFRTASESRSIYEITEDGCKIASREYITLFAAPE